MMFRSRFCRKELEAQAGADMLAGYSADLSSQPAAAMASLEGSILPTVKDVPSNNRVVLYRDTNGWCPFCSKARRSPRSYP